MAGAIRRFCRAHDLLVGVGVATPGFVLPQGSDHLPSPRPLGADRPKAWPSGPNITRAAIGPSPVWRSPWARSVVRFSVSPAESAWLGRARHSRSQAAMSNAFGFFTLTPNKENSATGGLAAPTARDRARVVWAPASCASPPAFDRNSPGSTRRNVILGMPRIVGTQQQ